MRSLGVSSSLALIVLLTIAATQLALAKKCGTGRNHNAIFGNPNPGDKLLHMRHVKLPSRASEVVTKDVNFSSKNNVITYIQILNRNKKGRGGCATIRSGGAGKSAVSIHLKSRRNQGLHFLVRIFGKHSNN